MSITTTMKSAQNVLYGPTTSGNSYQSVGSVSAGETVVAIVATNDQNWVQIEYDVTGTSYKKRGYVLVSTTNLTSVSGLPHTSDNGTITVKTGTSTYTGPSSGGYYSAGSVSTGEAVTDLAYEENGYRLIEYDVSGTSYKKRAYCLATNLNITSSGDNSNTGDAGDMANYKTYIQNQYIPTGFPMAGAVVTQGFNDKTTNHKGHLGYDLYISTLKVVPLFAGTVVNIKSTNTGGNGRTVCVKHTVNGTTFYSTYCHLKSISVSVGNTVTTSTQLGVMGGSGYGSDSYYGTHVHVCAYTGSPTTDPYGYCASGGTQTFEATTSYANAYYYGPDTTKFPRCGGVCFYDPYGVVTSNASVIATYHP